MQHPAAGASGYALVLAAGDKGLAAADAVQYKFLPLLVKLGQNVVQKQYGVLAGLGQVNLPLGKLY